MSPAIDLPFSGVLSDIIGNPPKIWDESKSHSPSGPVMRGEARIEYGEGNADDSIHRILILKSRGEINKVAWGPPLTASLTPTRRSGAKGLSLFRDSPIFCTSLIQAGEFIWPE